MSNKDEFRCRLRPLALALATDEDGKTSSENLEKKIAELQSHNSNAAHAVPNILVDQFKSIHEALMVLQTMIVATTAARDGELQLAMQQLADRTIDEQIQTHEKLEPENHGLNDLKQRLFQERELNREPIEHGDQRDKEIEDELERD